MLMRPAGHTVALVEDITGLTGVDELLLTLREAEPVRITRGQVSGVHSTRQSRAGVHADHGWVLASWMFE